MAAFSQQYRAFWADAFHAEFKTPAQVDQLIQDLNTARANAIFAEVRLDSVSYDLKSKADPADDQGYPQSFDALQYLIDRAHWEGIEVHAWFPVYPTWRSPTPPRNPDHIWHKHGPTVKGDDMWASIASNGKVSTSFDPGHPGVLAYLVDVFTDPLRHYDLDGIHLDYVRNPGDADYGWKPQAVEPFERLFARTGVPQPGDPRWADFRRLQGTQLVCQTYLRAVGIKPSVRVTAATVSWGNGPTSDGGFRSTDAFRRVFQDWRGWLEEGILDVAMPMNTLREQRNPVEGG